MTPIEAIRMAFERLERFVSHILPDQSPPSPIAAMELSSAHGEYARRVERSGGQFVFDPGIAVRGRCAVVFDRDDTLLNTTARTRLTEYKGDLVHPVDVELLCGVAATLREITERGWLILVVSNQGGVARGATNLRGVERINDCMRSLLPPRTLAGIYFCPYHPHPGANGLAEFTAEHPWRKPGGAMVAAALREHDVHPANAWAVGDKWRDVAAAVHAGVPASQCVLLNTTGEHGAALDATMVGGDVAAKVHLLPDVRGLPELLGLGAAARLERTP